VPADVAIYTLNQKRRELARIETDYAMAVAFLPKDDVLAGNFEIERTAARAPEDRKQFALDAPPPPETFVEAPSDLSEEVEEDEEHEDLTHAEPSTPSAEAHSHNGVQNGPRNEATNGEGGRRKRRRRRRGRDRGPTDQPQRMDQPQRSAPVADERFGRAPDDIPDTTPIDAPLVAAPSISGFRDNGAGGRVEGGEGEPRRRRRRRRGRRGGERFGAPANNLEGVPVDGSVRDSGEEITGTADDAVEADALVAKIETPVQPNMPSAPVWSLAGEQSRETTIMRPRDPVVKQDHAEPQKPPATPGEAAPPTRKGWWQRTFRSDG